MSREEFLPGSVVPKRFEWSTDWKRPRPSWSSSYGLKDTDKLVLWEGTGDPFFVRKDGSQRLPPKGVHLSSESIGLLYDLVDDGPLGLTALHENWPFAMHLYIIHPGYRPMGCAYKILKSGVWYFGVYRGYYLLCGDEGYTQFKDKEAEDAKKEGREPEDINEPERQPWVVGDVPEELNWHDDFDADQIRIYTEPFPVCHPPIAKDRVIVTDLARPSPSWRGKATRADIYASASYQVCDDKHPYDDAPLNASTATSKKVTSKAKFQASYNHPSSDDDRERLARIAAAPSVWDVAKEDWPVAQRRRS